MLMVYGVFILLYINLYIYFLKGNLEFEDENLNLINFVLEIEILNIILIC